MQTISLNTPNVSLIQDGTTNSYFSEGMIERALWTAGSAVCLTGAGATALSGFIAAPIGLTAIAVACLYKAYMTRNYDSSAEVAVYRKECKDISLESALENHGKYVFARKLLSPEEVKQKYLEAEQLLRNIPAITAFYSAIEKYRQQGDLDGSYAITAPIFRLQNQFQEICASLPFSSIENEHSLENIFVWRLLSQEDFSKKYRDYQLSLFTVQGIKAVIDHYRAVQEIQAKQPSNNHYTIPHPRDLSYFWYASLQNSTLTKIASDCSITDLISYGIIADPEDAQELQSMLQRLEGLNKKRSSKLASIEKTYTETLEAANSLFTREKRTIQIAKQAIHEGKLERQRRIDSLETQIQRAIVRGDWSLEQNLKEELAGVRLSQALNNITNAIFTESDLNRNLEIAKRQLSQAKTQAEATKKASTEAAERDYRIALTALEEHFDLFKASTIRQ